MQSFRGSNFSKNPSSNNAWTTSSIVTLVTSGKGRPGEAIGPSSHPPREKRVGMGMNRSHGATRVSGLRPTAVNTVLGEARALQAKGRSLVSLMRGQPDTPTPPQIVEAARRALAEGRTGYPDNQGEPALRGAVAAKLARDNNLTYDPGREILITDGATCGIATALAAILEPGDEVLIPDPIYDAYASPIALWG